MTATSATFQRVEPGLYQTSIRATHKGQTQASFYVNVPFQIEHVEVSGLPYEIVYVMVGVQICAAWGKHPVCMPGMYITIVLTTRDFEWEGLESLITVRGTEI